MSEFWMPGIYRRWEDDDVCEHADLTQIPYMLLCVECKYSRELCNFLTNLRIGEKVRL